MAVHWYVFHVALLVAVTATASRFSGAVMFQPFFAFVLRLPPAQSIATGITTETLMMSAGASRCYLTRQIRSSDDSWPGMLHARWLAWWIGRAASVRRGTVARASVNTNTFARASQADIMATAESGVAVRRGAS